MSGSKKKCEQIHRTYIGEYTEKEINYLTSNYLRLETYVPLI